MGLDAFIKFEKIPGESRDARCPEWIEVLAFSWGMRQPSGGSSAGGKSERCDFDNFTFKKSLDRASPLLARACATGKPQGGKGGMVALHLFRAIGEKQPYYGIGMVNVVVTSVKMEALASAADFSLPVETVSLSFSAIEWTYIYTDQRTGKPGGTVDVMWDLAANKLTS
ncbi:MAG TPA: type VI secretion system tube protein Hcp [Planctomycetota bacterium]|nr:type VI secretion system tube protein Hcp [Planctomycetota bacterium]